MKKAVFNKLINLEYPDDFVELTSEENKKYFYGDLLRLSFINKDRHIILSVSKSKDSIFNYLITIPSVVRSSISNMQNTLKDYEWIEEEKSTIFGCKSLTECFSYTASDKDIKQYGEMSVFKYKKAFYVVYCISRLEDKEESKKLFKVFRDSFAA